MIKTAECVSPRHPDKMCDQISDGILDWCLEQDPEARVAVEVMGGHGSVVIMGEVTMAGGKPIYRSPIEQIVKEVTGRDDLDVQINIVQQSRDIANGVDTGGAGDQGIMVGYACTDNSAMIPQEAYLAKSLCKFLYEKLPVDGKTQITMDGEKVTAIVASFQNTSKLTLGEWVNEWIKTNPTLLEEDFKDAKIFPNPAGDWTIGGFDADTGVTGRKIIVDAYGPQVPVGGGAFSGKDPSKVDRSGAYMARRIAIDTMKIFHAEDCTVEIAYAIGIAEPVMAIAYLSKHGVVTEHKLLKESEAKYLTPKAIREYLDLNRPQYRETAMWGHFGNGKFKWDI